MYSLYVKKHLPKLSNSCIGATLAVARTVYNIYIKRVGASPTPTNKVSPNVQNGRF